MIVTGGAGFIGANFVRLALAHESPRDRADKLTYAGNLDSLVRRRARPRFVSCTATSATAPGIEAAHRAPANLAGELRRGVARRPLDRRSGRVRADQHRRRVRAARCVPPLVVGASDAERRAFRFLHRPSTDEVYGTLGPDRDVLRDHAVRTGTRRTRRRRRARTTSCAPYHQTYGLPALITNCSNNYGPFQYPRKLIRSVLLNALQGKALPIYGDGPQRCATGCASGPLRVGILRVLEQGVPGREVQHRRARRDDQPRAGRHPSALI